MTRKSIIRTYLLETIATEILPYNLKRIAAYIYPEVYTSNGYLRVGNTAHGTEANPPIYAFYYPIEVGGINAIWAAGVLGTTIPQPITVVEIIEE